MVKCFKCKGDNPDNATFCAFCGESLADKCPKCGASVTKGMAFCTMCAMPLDGSTICPQCAAPLKKDEEFCSVCGLSKNGESVCVKCKTKLIPGARFCPKCGAAVANLKQPLSNNSQTYSATYNPPYYNVNAAKKPVLTAAEKNGRIAKSHLFMLIKTWVLTGILLLMFGLSFLPVFTVTKKVQGIEVEAKISAIDVIGATFSMIKPKSMATKMDEFQSYYEDNYSLDKDATEKEKSQENVRLLTKYGILKIIVCEETVKTSPSMVLQLTIWSLLTLALMATLLAFGIIGLVRSIKFTLGKSDKTFGFGTVSMALAFGLSFILGLLGGADFGIALILIMVFSATTMLGFTIINYIDNHSTLSVKEVVTKGVSLTLSMVLAALLCGTGMTIKAAAFIPGANGGPDLTAEEKIELIAKYDGFSLIGGIDLTKIKDEDSPYYDMDKQKLVAYYKSVLDTATLLKASGNTTKKINEFFEIAMMPYGLYTFLETDSNIAVGVVTGILTFLGMLAGLAGLGGISMYALGDLAENKRGKKRLLWYLLAFGGTFVMLISNIVNIAVLTNLFEQLKLKATFGIGAGIVASMVFAAIMLAGTCIANIKDKNQKLLNPTMNAIGGVEPKRVYAPIGEAAPIAAPIKDISGKEAKIPSRINTDKIQEETTNKTEN